MIRTKLSQGKSKKPCRTGMIKQRKETFLITCNRYRDSNIFLRKTSLLKIGVLYNMNKHHSEIVIFVTLVMISEFILLQTVAEELQQMH